ncbi:MAG: hypothetical protein KF773_16815 [Deltaproteobacteria bacterium]|nr:hypothetical protein [Deltaproteobacteria bacterium]
MPRDQTVEGGAQIRVTPAGFQKMTSILPGVLNQQLGAGFCIPQGSALGVTYCFQNNGQCAPGCKVNVTLNSLQTTVTSAQRLNLKLNASANTSVRVSPPIFSDCTLSITANSVKADLDIALGINPGNGELTVNLDRINSTDLSGVNFSGCSVLSFVGNLVVDILDSFLGDFIIQLLTPAINNIIQGFLPNPLGIAGMMDVGNLLESISPGTEALMEARIVPGGYVQLTNNGMSLGVITGLNADEDPSTRGPGLTSEPNLCVPPLPPPNFAVPPASLPLTSRSTFALGAAGTLSGSPEPNADLAMAISETTLDLAGHHAVTSGMMCLGVGTTLVSQLNVGTIGILVPSLSELASEKGNDPLLLVTRPQRALDFTIGDNTTQSPALTIGISHMEVDFYAFLYERYVRAFTLDLTMNIGVNLEFEQPPGMPAVIKPTLVGISADQVEIKVLNSQFVRETPQKLEMVLPSVFSLITPLLGNLPDIAVPSFAGFSLGNLRVQKITTSQDEFLALFASLGPSMAMRTLAQQDHFTADAVAAMDAQLTPPPPPAAGLVKLVGVTTPAPEKVRSALAKEAGGAMPEVEFRVDRTDAQGRELEWAYNLNGGLWHPYVKPVGNKLVVRDTAFAWQGKYAVGLKSRVAGDYRTVSAVTTTPVIIDSVGPRIFVEKAAWDGDTWSVPSHDVVSEHDVKYAFGRPGEDQPSSPWFEGAHISLRRGDMTPYLVDRELVVFVEDEAGNRTIALVAPFHGQPGEGGCDCEAQSAPGPGGLVLMGLVGLALVRRRRLSRAARVARAVAMRLARRGVVANVVVWAGLSVALSAIPGCSCGNATESCETNQDCSGAECTDSQLPFCLDGVCICNDNIPLGHLGPYSDVATGADGSIWVSAYHQSYGDLVVARVEPGRVPDDAWEWVDGVPAGAPVVVPDSKIRGGVAEKGDDVGMYTSIQVAPDGSPMVSYFDAKHASLKFAVKQADGWKLHTVDAGTGGLDGAGSLVGMYTSLTLRSDDGRPGIAYLAHVSDGVNVHAEVRFAASQVAVPTSAGDWMTWVVDTAPLPEVDPSKPPIYPLPEGLGLFIDSARLPNQAPVVVYYDRGAGDLRMAKFDPARGQFAPAVVLDGSGKVDAGWSPTVGVDRNGVVHVAYVSATGDNLMYVTDQPNARPELVDDGRRIVGTTVDGLPKPEYHFVGDDASITLVNSGTLPVIVYQDATTQQLLLATKQQNGTWLRDDIAGATDPWPGAYGFFAASSATPAAIVMSTWVIDQPNSQNWVEVFKRATVIQ